jgi:hypothetical protein
MPGTHDEDFPSAAADARNSPIRPDDERKASDIAGMCGSLLKESGFSLTEVGSDYAAYRNGHGHQVTVRGHRWSCKLASGAELSGVGFDDLSEVIRAG